VEIVIHLLLNEQAEALPASLLSMLKTCMEETLLSEEFPYDAEISFSITDDAEICEINKEQRGIEKPTDVLSFPMLSLEDDVLVIEDEDMVDENTVFLGDIVISMERAEAQAEAYGHSKERELGFLAVHSMLHLLGYDHETGKAEETEMFQKQESVLERVGLVRDR